MTNIKIENIIAEKLAGINTRTVAQETAEALGLEIQSEIFVALAEHIEQSDMNNSNELATFLYYQAQKALPRKAKGGKKKETPAQKRAKENAEKIMADKVLQEGIYYDAVGLVSQVDPTVESEPKARGTYKLLEEAGYIVALTKNLKFADGKMRKAFVLADQDMKATFVPYDLEEKVEDEELDQED